MIIKNQTELKSNKTPNHFVKYVIKVLVYTKGVEQMLNSIAYSLMSYVYLDFTRPVYRVHHGLFYL